MRALSGLVFGCLPAAAPARRLTIGGLLRKFSTLYLQSYLNEESSGGMYMKVKPLGDRVLVKLQYAEEKTAGGIIIPDTAQEKTQQGVVLAVGDDEAIKVKVKDKIMYDKYAGTTIKVNGEEQLILKMSDIIAKVED
jgi:chaperonin GroES